MPALNHVHTYERMRSKEDILWRCADPACNHYLRKEMAIGKLSRCPECGSEYILDREKMRRVKPVCIGCSNTKEGKKQRAIDKLMERILQPANEN